MGESAIVIRLTFYEQREISRLTPTSCQLKDPTVFHVLVFVVVSHLQKILVKFSLKDRISFAFADGSCHLIRLLHPYFVVVCLFSPSKVIKSS